jgi:hypothetical protein
MCNRILSARRAYPLQPVTRDGFHKAIYALCLKFALCAILFEQIYSNLASCICALCSTFCIVSQIFSALYALLPAPNFNEIHPWIVLQPGWGVKQDLFWLLLGALNNSIGWRDSSIGRRLSLLVNPVESLLIPVQPSLKPPATQAQPSPAFLQGSCKLKLKLRPIFSQDNLSSCHLTGGSAQLYWENFTNILPLLV